jgi:hypothetical protein
MHGSEVVRGFAQGFATVRRFAILLGLFVAARAEADCATSYIACWPASSMNTSDPAATANCFYQTFTAYDIPQGTIHFSALGEINQYRRCNVELRDHFTVHGLPEGTPIALKLRVRFQIDGASDGGPFGGLVFNLEARGYPGVQGDMYTTRQASVGRGSLNLDEVYEVVLHRTAGVPIGWEIVSGLYVGEASHCTVDLAFEFADLPPGTSVTSCNGFLQEGQVPAALTTWGKVKAAYR